MCRRVQKSFLGFKLNVEIVSACVPVFSRMKISFACKCLLSSTVVRSCELLGFYFFFCFLFVCFSFRGFSGGLGGGGGDFNER